MVFLVDNSRNNWDVMRAHSPFQLVQIWLATTLALLLSACALDSKRVETLPKPAPRVITVQATSTVDQLMTLILQARKLPQAEFIAERDRARTDYTQDRSDMNRVRLAVWLSLAPPAPTNALANNDDEIIALVDPIAFNGTVTATSPDPEVRALAVLIQSLVQVRKRQAELARETQVKTQGARRDELTVAQTEARNLRLKIEELEKQLAAYKSIFRSAPPRANDRSDVPPK